MSEAWWMTCLIGSTALDVAVIAAMLFVSTPGSLPSVRRQLVTWRRWGIAILIAGTLFVARFPVLVAMGLNLFGVIHLVYLFLVVTLPLAGLAVLSYAGSGGRRRWRHRADTASLVFAACTLLSPGVGIYASFIEPYRLVLEQDVVPIDDLRDGSGTVRIGVLSDVQTSRVTGFERRAVEELMEQEPDIILLAGDLFQGDAGKIEQEIDGFRDLLGTLDAPGGVFAVCGNVDASNRLLEMMKGTRVRLLITDVVRTRVGDRPVTIGGIQFHYRDPESRRVIDTLNTAEGDDLRILLSHHPDAVQLTGSRVDLVVAGHTHGGQVVLPGWGPLMTMSGLPRHVAAGGLHVIPGRARIYVSRGLGMERSQAPPVRFFCRPEIAVLTLMDEPQAQE